MASYIGVNHGVRKHRLCKFGPNPGTHVTDGYIVVVAKIGSNIYRVEGNRNAYLKYQLRKSMYV